MQIIVYSETDASTISSNLGVAEYSYYFVLQKYLPILESLGEVVYVRDPALEVDALYDRARADGRAAVFMSFSPPHRLELGLRCPTICILAWEFSSIPDETWGDNPRENWVYTLGQVSNVISISQYSTDVIKSQIPGPLNIATIPAPVSDLPVPSSIRDLHPPDATAHRDSDHKLLSVNAQVADTFELDISDHSARLHENADPGKYLPPWDRQSMDLVFDRFIKENNGYKYLVGFHDAEEWGTWSRTDRPWISLPFLLQGDFDLEIELVAFKVNDQKEVAVTIGNQSRSIVISPELTLYKLEFRDVCKGASIALSNLEIGYTLGALPLRALSVGIARLSITDSGESASAAENMQVEQQTGQADNTREAQTTNLQFNGLVYTSMFNPQDGRKNWEDIVTAFCWAFREDKDRTLILKFNCPTMSASWGRLFHLFSQLNPFACRIVVIHGYLTSQEMSSLVEATDYFVNASKAEGQCLPLLEFMAEGVPAIAPDHTAMSSYINDDNAFVVDSSRVATCWPQDPREYERTFFYRIDWASLRDCYLRSAELAETKPQEYELMALSAARTVREIYSVLTVGKQLEKYLGYFD